jgi:hypothetical protein
MNSIFVEFGGHSFQQIIGIPMGISCAPLLVDIFSYTYEADFMQKLLKDKVKLQNLKSLVLLSGILVIICQFIPKLYQLNSINIAKQIFLCLLS